jgi:ribosome modulation factor
MEPYTIPDDCPYLSEDQREISKLTFEQRAQWMAEWLALAQDTVDD